MSVTGEHWLGLSGDQVKTPTSRKEREKWGTPHPKARKKKNSWTIVELRLAVRLCSEGGVTGPPKTYSEVAVTGRRPLPEKGNYANAEKEN